MKSPRLSRRLALEAPQHELDGSGGFDVTWQTLGTLWAQVTARAGRETVSSGAPVSAVTYRIIVRAAPEGAPDRPMPQQRFREGERLYHIQAVVEDDLNGRFLTCFATEETTV